MLIISLSSYLNSDAVINMLCRTHQVLKKPPKAPGVIPETRVGAIWHLDTTDMPPDPQDSMAGLGKNVMLTMVEAASGFVMVAAQRGKTAATTSENLALLLGLVPPQADGQVVLIRIDDGVEFKKETAQFLWRQGYQTEVIRKEHNGKVERMHQTVMKQTDKVRRERQRVDSSITGAHWVCFLGTAVHNTNTQKNPGSKSSHQERMLGQAQGAVELYQADRAKKRAQRRRELQNSPSSHRVGDRVLFTTHSKTMSVRYTEATIVWVGRSHLTVVFLHPGFWNVLVKDEKEDRGRIVRHPPYNKPTPSGEQMNQCKARRAAIDIDNAGSATLVVDNIPRGFRWCGNSCFLDTAVIVLRMLAVPFGDMILRSHALGTLFSDVVLPDFGRVDDPDELRDAASRCCTFLRDTDCGRVGPGQCTNPGSLTCILNSALSETRTTHLLAVAICDECYQACEVSSMERVAMFSTVELARNMGVAMANIDEVIMANGIRMATVGSNAIHCMLSRNGCQCRSSFNVSLHLHVRPLLVLYRLKSQSTGPRNEATIWPYGPEVQAAQLAWVCVAAVMYRGDGRCGHYCCVVQTHCGVLQYDDMRRDGRLWQVGPMDDAFFKRYSDDSHGWYIQEALYLQRGAVVDYKTLLGMFDVLSRGDGGVREFTQQVWQGTYHFKGRNVFGAAPPGRRVHPENRNVPVDADGYQKYCGTCGDGGELHMCARSSGDGCGRVYHHEAGCLLPDWCRKPGKDDEWLCPVGQKADQNRATFIDDSTGQSIPGKVPGLLDACRDRFEYRRTRALKQFDEYLHGFRQWSNEARSNTGAVVRHHTTQWAMRNVLLAATSEEYAKWAEGVFKLVVGPDGFWAPFEDWDSWRGTGHAGPQVGCMEEENAVDDEERESGGPGVNELFDMVDMDTQPTSNARCKQSKGNRLVDMEDNRLDVDLLAKPEAKVQFVKRRRTVSTSAGRGQQVGKLDEVLYEEGVEDLELDDSEESADSGKVCTPSCVGCCACMS